VIGRQLGGRYEILDRVGGGGMAVVYKGLDILLNRHVAVKVLRQQYVNDEEFIRRFRREAQSAASLSHPNIVSIYDVGQEEEIHYIVMEYVEGTTLNEVIKERAPLQVEEAINITSQICDALDHAHTNQIIHRDIKPHNILIGKNGRAKVTDFGIARATTASTITQTGSVVGSVHYFSPEHAKGIHSGAKSDLYSLGIVLYQMLTAKLPFSGDSPISIALKHLQETMESPRKVNPLIPQSVENIIMKATRKDQVERYQSAKQMLEDLDSCLTPQRRNEPKISFSHEDDPDELDDERTRVVPKLRSKKVSPADTVAAVDDDSLPIKKRNFWIGPLIWFIIFLATIAVLWFVVLPAVKENFSPKDVQVPQLLNMNVKDAEALLTQSHLLFTEKLQADPTVAKDLIISYDPSNITVKEGSTINLVVSTGTEQNKMPQYVGRKYNDVYSELINANIPDSQITMTEEPFPDPEGTIMKQTPDANTMYDPSTQQFTFIVSSGSQQVSMPNLIGHTVDEATNMLTMVNMKLAPLPDGIITKPSFAQPKGKIFDQFPVNPGDEITPGQDPKDPSQNIIVYVSSGDPTDAGTMNITEVLNPAVNGTASTFLITLNDAKNSNANVATKQVSQSEVYTMQVTVTKDTNAVVRFLRDNVLYDTLTFTYNDYLNQNTVPTATPTPSGISGPTETPDSTSTPVIGPTPSPTPEPAVNGSNP